MGEKIKESESGSKITHLGNFHYRVLDPKSKFGISYKDFLDRHISIFGNTDISNYLKYVKSEYGIITGHGRVYTRRRRK